MYGVKRTVQVHDTIMSYRTHTQYEDEQGRKGRVRVFQGYMKVGGCIDHGRGAQEPPTQNLDPEKTETFIPMRNVPNI